MLNSQIPFNQLPELSSISMKEKKSLLQASDACKHVLFHLNGYLDAMEKTTVYSFLNVLHIADTKYSFDLEDQSISLVRLFEAYASENSSNDKTATCIFNYIEWYKNVNIFDIESLQPSYLSILKKHQDYLRDKIDIQITSYFTNLTLYTSPNNQAVIQQLSVDLNMALKVPLPFDSLVYMSLVHYQFRALSPYVKMNGHVARTYSKKVLTQLQLQYDVLPLSMILIKQKEKYNTLMRDIALSGDHTEWCLFMIQVYKEAAEIMLSKLKRFEQLRKNVLDQILKYTDYDLPALDLHTILFESPFIKSKILIDTIDCHRQTAYTYLNHLVKMGILVEKNAGREKLYYQKDFLDILSN